jgi:thymidine kinase
MADEIINLTAICKHEEYGRFCGQDASRTQRLVNGQPANYNDPIIMIGAEEAYTARCLKHHLVPGKPVLKVVQD